MDVIINCGDYEISDVHEISQLGLFIKTKSYKGNKSLVKEYIGKINNLH